MKEKLRLYLIADFKYYDENFLKKVEEAIKGGVTAVQVRCVETHDRKFLHIAREVQKITQDHDVLFFINNRADIAFILDADGLHLGQEDLPVEEARRIVGNKIIGISVGNEYELDYALKTDADYLSFGSVFVTPTKEDAGEPIGAEGLRKLVKLSDDRPKIAIGGITLENVKEVMDAGVDGIAVSSALMLARNPFDVAKKFREITG